LIPDFIKFWLQTLALLSNVAALLKAFPHRTITAPAIYEGHRTHLATFCHEPILGALSHRRPSLKKIGHRHTPYSSRPRRLKTP
jgi:hypothetical protein